MCFFSNVLVRSGNTRADERAAILEHCNMCRDCYNGLKSAALENYLDCAPCIVDQAGEECQACLNTHEELTSCPDCGECLCDECFSECENCNNDCMDCVPCIFGIGGDRCETECNSCKACAACVPCA